MQTSTALESVLIIEAEVAELLKLAQETAAAQILEAQHQAQTLKDAALKAGRLEGQAEHERLLTAARAEADLIVAAAQAKARSIDDLSPESMRALADDVVSTVIGLDQEGTADDA